MINDTFLIHSLESHNLQNVHDRYDSRGFSDLGQKKKSAFKYSESVWTSKDLIGKYGWTVIC